MSDYDANRELFIDTDTRFQESLTSAFANHAKCVALFLATLERVEQREDALQTSVADLRESVEELKKLLMEKGGPST